MSNLLLSFVAIRDETSVLLQHTCSVVGASLAGALIILGSAPMSEKQDFRSGYPQGASQKKRGQVCR